MTDLSFADYRCDGTISYWPDVDKDDTREEGIRRALELADVIRHEHHNVTLLPFVAGAISASGRHGPREISFWHTIAEELQAA